MTPTALFDYHKLFEEAADSPLAPWLSRLPSQLEAIFQHGDMPRWLEALKRLPDVAPSTIDLTEPCLKIGLADDIDESIRDMAKTALLGLSPWRKGPFCPFGIHIDTEWHSDWKWARVEPHIQPLSGRRVLDVGSGNGYYGWRMLGAGARQVIGVDPSVLFTMQYFAMRHFIGDRPLYILPLTLEALTENTEAFDTVFSMGVLYHRKDPQEHLARLRGHLRPGGELVLEGLVIEGKAGDVLIPQNRYAKMRNVWSIPSCATLEGWLEVAGFRSVRLVDLCRTTVEEQRRTEWMHFESLADFLDPSDPSKTIEGYPAPMRAVFLAEKGRD